MTIKLKHIIISIIYIIATIGLSVGWFSWEVTFKSFLTGFCIILILFHIITLIIDNWDEIIWKS